MPIEVKVIFSDATDTIFSVVNDINNQEFNFEFNKQPGQLIFDPNNNIVLKVADTVVGIEESKEILPHKWELEQNYPNPFNPVTTISYSIPQRSNVTLKVYDILGNLVNTLVNGYKDKGRYKVNFNGSKLSSGVYLYRLVAGRFTDTKKLILMK